MTVGPELPSHLAKRKHDSEQASNGTESQSPEEPEKRRRILGPAPPPAPLDEKPEDPASDSESSSDDDYGPAMPPAPGSAAEYAMEAERREQEEKAALEERQKKPQREEWMLAPPSGDDWSSRFDPTKLKNRKFNTGKGAKNASAGSGGISAIWTETPEEKRQRLEDEVMGRKDPARMAKSSSKVDKNDAEAEATAKRIQEYNDKNRSKSLLDEHKKNEPREKEDDPSARGFDKEKDMGLGRTINHTQKKEMLNKSKDFGSRFARGSFL